MKTIKNIPVKGLHNRPLVTDVIYKKNKLKKPVVILCHGYKGFKDWGAWNSVAKTFAENDLFFVKFNFSHNGGTLEDPIDFPDLDAFGKNNLTMELDDLGSVIDWILSEPQFQNEIDKNDITLIGHSRGGGIAIVKTSEDVRVKRLITWAALSDFGARLPHGKLLEQWKKEGVAYIINSRTKQQMPHYYQFYENFINNRERLNIKAAAERIKVPFLIVHGTQDETVPFSEAEALHHCNPKSELYEIENGNHSFGSVQPNLSGELPEDLKKVVKRSINFITGE